MSLHENDIFAEAMCENNEEKAAQYIREYAKLLLNEQQYWWNSQDQDDEWIQDNG